MFTLGVLVCCKLSPTLNYWVNLLKMASHCNKQPKLSKSKTTYFLCHSQNSYHTPVTHGVKTAFHTPIVSPDLQPNQFSHIILSSLTAWPYLNKSSPKARCGCVVREDKSSSVRDVTVSVWQPLRSQIPGPILLGYVIDRFCYVWKTSCEGETNCWLYDMDGCVLDQSDIS